MLPGQTMYDESNIQVPLFPLERFYNKSSMV